MSIRPLLIGALVLAVCPRHASAQIYAWRDANGTLNLSDRKLESHAATYDVPGAPTYRTTTAPASSSAVGRYEPLVLEHAARQSLRPELVRAVIQVESGYNTFATSPKGAMGLMQLMPQTARELGVLNAYDPEENISGGTRYLRMLLDKYAGNEELALAAYNAGSGAVDKYGRRIPPYRETRDYVRKVGSKAGQGSPASAPARVGARVYKTIDIVDGRPVARYSTTPPDAGEPAEIVKRQ